MTEETTNQFIARRKKELLAQISVLEGQLNPKKIELAQLTRFEASLATGDLSVTQNSLAKAISQAAETISNSTPNVAVVTPPVSYYGGGNALTEFTNSAAHPVIYPKTTNALAEITAKFGESFAQAGSAMSNAISRAMYGNMTIKEMVIQALLDHFPNGATATEIREYIRNGYGRDVDPSSLRPQMHRLKADTILLHDSETDLWNLSVNARRNYSMYDHPTSRSAMKELQDDKPLPWENDSVGALKNSK